MAKTKLKSGYKREYYDADCPDCEGLGYREYEHGLIRVSCITCQGTGKVRKERRIPKKSKQPLETCGVLEGESIGKLEFEKEQKE